MLRVGLIAYLLLATIAGPAWCCCTLGRAIACALPAPAVQETAEPTCCCCVKKPVASEEAKKPSRESQDRNEPCPCKETREAQASYYVASNRSDLVDGHFAFDVMAWASVASLDSVVLIAAKIAPDTSPPPRSGQEILLAHQIFRC